MAFPDEILAGFTDNGTNRIDVDLWLEQDAYAEPVSLQELKDHLRITDTEIDSVQEINLGKLITTARRRVEDHTNQALLEQTWSQTYDRVGRRLKLRRGPRNCLGVVKIEYISTLDDDTKRIWDPGQYIVSGDEVLARRTWPTHRGFQSFIVTYRVGYSALSEADAGDTDLLAAARAKVPYYLKEAVMEWAGHMWEHPEGSTDIRYESQAKRNGEIPPGVAALLEPALDWRLR